MFLGKVIGSVWATQKEEGMDNLKLLVVMPIDFKEREAGQTVIAADRIGAGVGERVIVSRGSPARVLFSGRTVPIDAMVVGIVDNYEVEEDAE
ncbi:ethanolamine utilization protein EutN [Paenibacillus darwinianus]|uniref:Ethanolamine utilization protein EutN n=1 Tax=Paenibacillus darwinianus TaxID=1380763 RepID=A0A9W5W703_9BACL|nr:EutN/CcmL family microcompartment protein [Paenibacillus darwinianus]EXX87790.1 ethanolamine utilization protein EutN [Paenibacillus darwinianus]EXX88164.1 ethanolamine utilization protein EutN [Paenibacillus darwinianus]EXX89043.1 ethanolamine utilization protein EutN [Paenibacillus darwinianus]